MSTNNNNTSDDDGASNSNTSHHSQQKEFPTKKRKRWVSDDDDDDDDNNNNNKRWESDDEEQEMEKEEDSHDDDDNSNNINNNNNDDNTNDNDDVMMDGSFVMPTSTTTSPKNNKTSNYDTNTFLTGASTLKRKGDVYLRQENFDYAAKSYFEAGLSYLKYCEHRFGNVLDKKKNSSSAKKQYFKTLRDTAKLFRTSGKLFEQKIAWNEAILGYEVTAMLFLICSNENLSKMNIISNTILNKNMLKKEHRKIAYEYIKYTNDFLSAQRYNKYAQKLKSTHNVTIASHNGNDSQHASYLNVFHNRNLSFYIEKIEHYYKEFSVAGI